MQFSANAFKLISFLPLGVILDRCHCKFKPAKFRVNTLEWVSARMLGPLRSPQQSKYHPIISTLISRRESLQAPPTVRTEDRCSWSRISARSDRETADDGDSLEVRLKERKWRWEGVTLVRNWGGATKKKKPFNIRKGWIEWENEVGRKWKLNRQSGKKANISCVHFGGQLLGKWIFSKQQNASLANRRAVFIFHLANFSEYRRKERREANVFFTATSESESVVDAVARLRNT